MTIKTNANCKLLAKCCQPTKSHASAGHPPHSQSPQSPQPTDQQQQQQQQLVVSMRVALLHDHKLQAGRPALLRATRILHEHYQLCQGTRTRHTHTHVEPLTHSLTRYSRQAFTQAANTLLLLYLVGAGAQQSAASSWLNRLCVCVLARPTSCASSHRLQLG